MWFVGWRNPNCRQTQNKTKPDLLNNRRKGRRGSKRQNLNNGRKKAWSVTKAMIQHGDMTLRMTGSRSTWGVTDHGQVREAGWENRK